ncbi:MAG TPA: adenylate/guanylate cyclase domain-containing protein [Acidimicrobiales bacterium]
MAERPLPEVPRPPTPAAGGGAGGLSERVADADRDRTVTMLREHVVEGRLTLDEFSQRMGAALEARTRGDLDAVMADLPAPSSTSSLPATVGTPRKTSRWHIAVMSGHSTRGRWRIGGKTKAVAVMGGCDMDLRSAEIEGPEVEITALAFWGGINIIVPEGFDVDLRGFSFMGGRSLRLKDVPIVRGSPRIVVRGFAVMGSVEVKSRPNRSAKQLGSSVSGSALGALEAATRSGDFSDLAAIGKDLRRELRDQFRQQRQEYRDVDRAGRRNPTADPAPVDRPSDGTVTILFCDMVDYAGMTERLGDQASHRILHEHHRIVREALDRHGGREIKVQGDGFMIAFSGVARAMRCAIDIQRAIRNFVAHDGEKIAVHIGINTGDAVQEEDDYLGYTVIVASRLADTAAPGEILVSSLSEQLVQGSGEFNFDGHRETHLKGMSRAQLSASLNWAD